MTTPAEQFAAILREQREQPDVIGETVAAVLAGNVIDNIAVTSATIAGLMATYADQLAELAGEEGDQ